MVIQQLAQAALASLDGARDSRESTPTEYRQMLRYWHMVFSDLGYPPASGAQGDILRRLEEIAGYWIAA